MKLTSKGQVTVPLALREKYGLLPHTEVEFEEAADGVLLRAAPAARQRRLERCLSRARGSATAKRSTDEIMRLTRGEN